MSYLIASWTREYQDILHNTCNMFTFPHESKNCYEECLVDTSIKPATSVSTNECNQLSYPVPRQA